jgi:Cap4 SAVED domain
MTPNLSEELKEALKGVYDGIDARLVEVPYKWSCRHARVHGKFFYLSFRDGLPTVQEFAKYVYHRIVSYCLPRRTRDEKTANFTRTRDFRYVQELLDQAKELFVKARNSQKTSGEPAEVILFILLEAFLRAPQVVCKMFLKTSENMPVHGSDSVHVGVGEKPGSVCLIWGESKLYKSLAAALDQICSSLTDFRRVNGDRSSRDRDIDIIVDHLDVPDHLKAPLLDYFDPYRLSNFREEAYACLVGFDDTKLAKLDELHVSEREEAFKSYYTGRIASACDLFCEKLLKSGLSDLKIYFFLIPLPSVADFRSRFFSHLGIVS